MESSTVGLIGREMVYINYMLFAHLHLFGVLDSHPSFNGITVYVITTGLT